MDYTDKVILAPMVRIGTLPSRLLALDYGADIVYTEELIDFKLLQCTRKENELLGTVDFVWTDGTVIYRTCPQERGRVVLQMGTADAARAEKVARLVQNDVSGIDINMGCPKEFSIRGGMGAALLTQPEKVKSILTTLVKAVSIPVTCKIRILETVEETLRLVRVIEETGVSAIAIHGRQKHERPRHDNHNDMIRGVALATTIPVIANGGSKNISTYEDIIKFREDTGAASVMVARAAQWNISVFRREGVLPLDTVIKQYLRYSVDYDNHEMNVKYCVQQMLHEDLDCPRGQALLAAVTVREICSLWRLEGYYDDVLERRSRREIELRELRGQTSAFKKRKLLDGSEITEMCFKYRRKEYPDDQSPKMILYGWTQKNKLPNPAYATTENKEDKTYNTILHVDDRKYSSTFWDKSKKSAEQAAAVVCLLSMGMSDGRRDLATPNNYSATPDNHSATPDNHSATPDNQSATPDNQSATPDNHSATPDNQSATPDNHSATPDNRSATPDHHSVHKSHRQKSSKHAQNSDSQPAASPAGTSHVKDCDISVNNASTGVCETGVVAEQSDVT